MADNEKKMDTRKANQRKRSIALGLILGIIVIVFYVLTIVKVGPGVFQQPM